MRLRNNEASNAKDSKQILKKFIYIFVQHVRVPHKSVQSAAYRWCQNKHNKIIEIEIEFEFSCGFIICTAPHII